MAAGLPNSAFTNCQLIGIFLFGTKGGNPLPSSVVITAWNGKRQLNGFNRLYVICLPAAVENGIDDAAASTAQILFHPAIHEETRDRIAPRQAEAAALVAPLAEIL